MLRTTHTVRFSEASDLSFLDDASVHLTVTSPPYPMIAMWDQIFGSLDPEAGRALEQAEGPRAWEAMHRILDITWKGIFRCTVPGGIVCVNIGDAARTVGGLFRLYPNHARTIQGCLDAGFESLPVILWRKTTNAPNKFMGSGMLPARAYVTLEHEYILIFRKPGKREFHTAEDKFRRRESAYFWEERNIWFSDMWRFTGARQTMTDSGSRERSGAFPFVLPYRLIQMFSLKGDTVLDPFAGTMTTSLAALCSCRNSVSVEIDETLGTAGMNAAPTLTDTFNGILSDRVEAHKSFVTEYEAAKKPCRYRNRHYRFPVVTSQEQELFFNPLTAIERQGSIITGVYTSPSSPE